VFDNVIDANTLTGTFGSLVIAGANTSLLTLAATYDAGENVDLTMTRNAFDSVGGMTVNQTSAASGIENVYSSTMSGPMATMLATMFTQDAATYAGAIDQLSGSQYASYLQSLSGVGGQFNGLLSQVGQCAVTTELRSACRQEAKGRIWGQTNYGRMTKDGDVEAPSYKANQYHISLGTDFNVSESLVLGVAGAYVQDDLNFSRHNATLKSDGYQAGAYAVYAPGQYYLKGVVSYTSLKGDANRSISIGTTTGTVTGKPEAEIWTLSGEVGYNLNIGSSSITPYLGVDHTAAKLKSFTETGVAAANLEVFESAHDRTATNFGVRWTGQIGGVVPELDLGWRHQFGGPRASILAQYDIAPGSDFTAISQLEKRDQAVVGVAVTGKLGSVGSFRLGYQGRFNGDVKNHSGGLTFVIPLGAK